MESTLEHPKDTLRILYERPSLFSQKVLGGHPWSKQVEIMESVRDNPRTTVRSSNGVGKDWTASEIVLWWLYTRYPSIVITTAPTNRQVEDVLWGEIRKKWANSRVKLEGKLLQTKLTLGDKWYATGFSTDQEAQFQGFHEENILIIFSEAQGIPQMIWDAAEGCMTSKGARMLVIGNPIGIGTTFHKTFTSPIWNKIHISAFDSPNVISGKLEIPSLVTREWVDERKAEWGEDSPLYQARVLGDFPTESDDTLISLNWIERATNKRIEIGSSRRVLGVDIARYGTNETVVADFDGFRCAIPIIRMGSSLVDSAGSIMDYLRNFDVEKFRQHEVEIFADDVGVGGGLVDILGREGYKIRGIVGNAVPTEPEKFFDMRAEMYWELRERFRMDTISIPDDDKLKSQLACLKYEYTTRGQIRLISKEKLKKSGQESPDRSDALAMAVWGHKNGDKSRGTKLKMKLDHHFGGGAGGY
jgi:hypothetical protein